MWGYGVLYICLQTYRHTDRAGVDRKTEMLSVERHVTVFCMAKGLFLHLVPGWAPNLCFEQKENPVVTFPQPTRHGVLQLYPQANAPVQVPQSGHPPHPESHQACAPDNTVFPSSLLPHLLMQKPWMKLPALSPCCLVHLHIVFIHCLHAAGHIVHTDPAAEAKMCLGPRG